MVVSRLVLARMAVALAAAVALPTLASAEGGHGGSAGTSNRIAANFTMPSDAEEPEEAVVFDEAGVAGPRVVDIPTLSLPSFADDELYGYFFVDMRLIVVEGVDAWKIRDKAHLIRDALIRTGHRQSVGDLDHPSRIDMEKAREILRDGLSGVVPLEEIERLEITNVDSPAR